MRKKGLQPVATYSVICIFSFLSLTSPLWIPPLLHLHSMPSDSSRSFNTFLTPDPTSQPLSFSFQFLFFIFISLLVSYNLYSTKSRTANSGKPYQNGINTSQLFDPGTMNTIFLQFPLTFDLSRPTQDHWPFTSDLFMISDLATDSMCAIHLNSSLPRLQT